MKIALEKKIEYAKMISHFDCGDKTIKVVKDMENDLVEFYESVDNYITGKAHYNKIASCDTTSFSKICSIVKNMKVV